MIVLSELNELHKYPKKKYPNYFRQRKFNCQKKYQTKPITNKQKEKRYNLYDKFIECRLTS